MIQNCKPMCGIREGWCETRLVSDFSFLQDLFEFGILGPYHCGTIHCQSASLHAVQSSSCHAWQKCDFEGR